MTHAQLSTIRCYAISRLFMTTSAIQVLACPLIAKTAYHCASAVDTRDDLFNILSRRSATPDRARSSDRSATRGAGVSRRHPSSVELQTQTREASPLRLISVSFVCPSARVQVKGHLPELTPSPGLTQAVTRWLTSTSSQYAFVLNCFAMTAADAVWDRL